ncbi:MAG: bifunctional protein-serine/threonine kinase/phosphatase [Gammaproteobacteria bacterium]|nr:bifunctional protein-serine/threonine kinase/phosphatase [Gammaproteobacteria bacterium]
MSASLKIAVGQYSDKGRKPVNQDFHGVTIPAEPLLAAKGIGIAIADGISSSEVSQEASQTAVKGFFADYYSTPESWSVKSSAQRVLFATNSWLYSQTRNGPYRYDINRGYVCTFSALVFKSRAVHVFHIGDARIYRVSNNRLEPLTDDHRLQVSPEQSYLSRALGMRDRVDIDYSSLDVETGDTFILATDGVYEYVSESFVIEQLRCRPDNLDLAARQIAEEALRKGSKDNLTIQVARVDQLPDPGINELHKQVSAQPFAPELRPRMQFDGYEIARELHSNHRSHVYLATDTETGERVALKVPSVSLRADPFFLESFLMEEWVARRVENAHVLKPCKLTRKRNYLYSVTEYIEGCTLAQWMRDNPQPDVELVRGIVEQIVRGLQALHRQEMLHQDLRPDNIMIDRSGTVKLIDFGSVRVAGVAEIAMTTERQHILGTAQYTAPEYFLGEPGTFRSDLFSLGVIAYQMLSGRLPYGAAVARAASRTAQRKLAYQPIAGADHGIPAWIDGALRKAVSIDPLTRHDVLSEFVHDLRHPNPRYLRQERAPLLERNPVLFWQGVSLCLALMVIYQVVS